MKALTGMNSHDFNCTNSDEWHQNLLEGCNDVVIRLTHVIDILRVSHQADVPFSRRLRLVGVAERKSKNSAERGGEVAFSREYSRFQG